MKDLATLIDSAVRANNTEAPRGYLGASVACNKCKRATWYSFRWVYFERHLGRLLRLFRRGHREEETIVADLRLAGAEVREYSGRLMYHADSDNYVCIDWDAEGDHAWSECDDVSQVEWHIKRAIAKKQGPLQWVYSDGDGHLGGHSDGQIRWPGILPDSWGGLECKTHNDKSFKNLQARGVLSAKLEHYLQMQLYMYYFKLQWTLYIAVNKNDDTYYLEIIPFKPELAEQHINSSKAVVAARHAPPRLSNDPSWFECRFCAYREICHYDDVCQKNCRSCAYARTAENGQWHCERYSQIIPADFIPKGCDNWEQVR